LCHQIDGPCQKEEKCAKLLNKTRKLSKESYLTKKKLSSSAETKRCEACKKQPATRFTAFSHHLCAKCTTVLLKIVSDAEEEIERDFVESGEVPQWYRDWQEEKKAVERGESEVDATISEREPICSD
jgi:hypothetical protein